MKNKLRIILQVDRILLQNNQYREEFLIKLINKCSTCSKYTLSKEICPECSGKTKSAHPARFSPEDKWGVYRRRLLLQQSMNLRNRTDQDDLETLEKHK